MEIKVCVIFVSLVIGVNCNQGNVQFEQDTAISGFTCSATEQIEGIVLAKTIQMCISECARTDGCKSVFYTHSECIRCRSRYKDAGDARLLPMAGSVSYRTVARCDPGWLLLKDSCYQWNSITNMTFAQAKDYCSRLGAHVLYIDKEEEKDVAAHIVPATVSGVWIAIQLKDGRWISSIDATPVPYLNFAAGELVDSTIEHCVSTHKSYQWQWFDSKCTLLMDVVCEKDII